MNFFTVSQAANHSGVSASTIRNYTADFERHFSHSATPDKGGRRSYSDDDIAKLRCIAEMKAQGKGDGEINASLDAGEWLDFGVTQSDAKSTNSELMVRLSATMAQLEATSEERNRLLDDLSDARERLLDAEKRAAVSEFRADRVKELEDERESLRAKLEALEGELKAERNKKWWRRG